MYSGSIKIIQGMIQQQFNAWGYRKGFISLKGNTDLRNLIEMDKFVMENFPEWHKDTLIIEKYSGKNQSARRMWEEQDETKIRIILVVCDQLMLCMILTKPLNISTDNWGMLLMQHQKE